MITERPSRVAITVKENKMPAPLDDRRESLYGLDARYSASHRSLIQPSVAAFLPARTLERITNKINEMRAPITRSMGSTPGAEAPWR